jgi:hypothetical protein
MSESLDSQVASAGNNIVESIQKAYSSNTIDNSVISNPTAALSQRVPQNKIELPFKSCNLDIDFLNTYNNLDMSKDIKSLSLDPVMKRLIQEKNDILRAIEGWVASQANDGARQPLLATTITKWIQKAIGYMRCGIMLIQQITELINGWITAILALIDNIEQLIMSDIIAANRLITQMQTIGDQLKNEASVMQAILRIYAYQDFIALYNETLALEKQVNSVKAQFSKDHMKAMQTSLLNSFLCILNMFNRTVNRIQRNKNMQVSLQSAVTNLRTQLAAVKNIDLTIPINPGGINPGALSNFTITNNNGIFTSYDSLTKTTLLNQLNNAKLLGIHNITEWTTIFTASEAGYITFSANNFGAFQLGATFDMPSLCPGSNITGQLIINGGDWVIQTSVSGKHDEIDDNSITGYATKNGIFTKVPSAPSPIMQMKVAFDDFIRAINRPAILNTYAASHTLILDPTQPGVVTPTLSNPNGCQMISVPDIYNDNGDYYVLQGTLPTLSDPTGYTVDDVSKINQMVRYPTQSEIAFFEAQYTSILQTLNVSVDLYNPSIYNFLNTSLNPLASSITIPNTLTKLEAQIYVYILNLNPGILALDLWALLNTSTLHYPIYNSGGTDIVLGFSLPFDTQLQSNLLGSKPFAGLQIYTSALTFEICRYSSDPLNMPYFIDNGGLTTDHVVSFGIQADWGFAPIAQLS